MDMITTGSATLNKILAIFTHLMTEARNIRDYIEGNALQAIVLYGEGAREEVAEGEAELMIGSFLATMGSTFECVSYAKSVVANLVNQLNAGFNKRQPRGKDLYSTLFKKAELFPLFDALGLMLGGLAMLDTAIADNTNIAAHWEIYKRLVQLAKESTEKYGCSVRQERQFRKCLQVLDRTVFTADCFNLVLTSDLYDKTIGANEELDKAFNAYFTYKTEAIYSFMESQYESDEFRQYLDLLSVYALYRRLYRGYDKKVFKTIWAIQRKAPAIVITGLTVLFPAFFLMKYCAPPKSTTVDPKDMNAYIQEYVQKRDATFSGFVSDWHSKFCTWAARMDSNTMATTDIPDKNLLGVIDSRGRLILHGVLLSWQIRSFVELFLALHVQRNIPIKTSDLGNIFKCLELLKAIKQVYQKKQAMVTLSIGLVQRLAFQEIIEYLEQMKATLAKSKDASKTDLIQALCLAFDLGKTTISTTKSDLLRLIISLIGLRAATRDSSKGSSMSEVMWKMQLHLDINYKLRNCFDCKFMYWSKELVAPMLSWLLADQVNLYRFKYLFAVLEDCAEWVKLSTHMDGKALSAAFVDSMQAQLHNVLIKPLCERIEEDLRYQIHSIAVEGLSKPNPMEGNNLGWFVHAEPFRFGGRLISFRQAIEDHLDEVFYNLTAINPGDWEVYEAMRALANQKYRLSLPQTFLPSKKHDQRVDLIDIGKKLAPFTARFKYNLHCHFFIEVTSEENSCTAVTLTHIGNSLKTHGLGVVNTMINATYRLLAKRFHTFTQFLINDAVVSPLMADREWFRQSRETENYIFPYVRAMSTMRTIVKLGNAEIGQTFLDKFRGLITQVGNAIALIRMIKFASLNLTWTATQFIPDTLNVEKFKEKAETFSPQTQEASETLDKVISSMTKAYTEETDYFGIIVKTFQGVLMNADSRQLKLFYMIVPSLTINFVEAMLVAKEKLERTRQTETYFTVLLI